MTILAPLRAVPRLVATVRARLAGAFIVYLTEPIERPGALPRAGAQPLPELLRRGDVLLSEGNTRVARLVKRLTRSTWSHVSMYVGPLEDGHDPRCIVEADLAAGVRSIRLSELDALNVRVLRPSGLDHADRSRMADWVVSRVGSEYDLAHAWLLGRKLLPLPLRPSLRAYSGTVSQTATRFICCSLLTHAFALVGAPLSTVSEGSMATAIADHGSVTPGDFERASVFEVVGPT